MLNIKIKAKYLAICISVLFTAQSYAKIDLINSNDLLTAGDHFELTTKGSLRLQALNFDHYNESNASQLYRRNGYSSTSRMYLNADYKFNDDLHVIVAYQNFINPPKILDWEGHYREGDSNINTEQLYAGIASDHYGTLKYGKMYSIYYDVVGSKTDIWDYSTLGQAQTWSPFAYYDATQASRKTLRYEKKSKQVDVYAAYLFKDETQNHDLEYQRKSGQELALDVRINDQLSWATSWKHNAASLKSDDITNDFSQQIFATSLFYFDGQWMLGLGAGWYKNLLPNYDALGQIKSALVQKFLNTEAYGLEYYIGYHVPIADHGIKYIQPYVMGNHLKYSHAYDFSRTDHGVGVAVRFNHGIGFDYERLYTDDSMNTPDMHLFRLRYEW